MAMMKEPKPPVHGECTLRIRSDLDILTAREKGRSLATTAGFSGSDLTVISTLISDLARKMISFDQRGTVVIQTVERGSQRGIAVTLSVDIARQNQNSAETAFPRGHLARDERIRSLAAGHVADQFDVWASGHGGTMVRVVKWA